MIDGSQKPVAAWCGIAWSRGRRGEGRIRRARGKRREPNRERERGGGGDGKREARGKWREAYGTQKVDGWAVGGGQESRSDVSS